MELMIDRRHRDDNDDDGGMPRIPKSRLVVRIFVFAPEFSFALM